MEAGVLIAAGLRVPCAPAGEPGCVRVGGTPGVTLRPLSFRERSAILRHALLDGDPVRPAASGILTLSASGDLRSEDATLLEIAALLLAGAQQEAPPFAEALRLAQVRTGLSGAELEMLPARDVDGLAAPSDASDSASGWRRIVFAPLRDLTAEEVRDALAGRLLARCGAAASEDCGGEDASAQSTAGVRNPAHFAVPAAGRIEDVEATAKFGDGRASTPTALAMPVHAKWSATLPPAKRTAAVAADPQTEEQRTRAADGTMALGARRPSPSPDAPASWSAARSVATDSMQTAMHPSPQVWFDGTPGARTSPPGEPAPARRFGFSADDPAVVAAAQTWPLLSWVPQRTGAREARTDWSRQEAGAAVNGLAFAMRATAPAEDIAEALANLLNEEADLRGID